MSDVLFLDKMIHATPAACAVDLVPPSFAGISALVANLNGSLTASWALATDSTAPISYDVYIASGSVSPAALFQSLNLVQSSLLGQATLFTDASGDLLAESQTYTVGVRARDGVGNQESNVVTLEATSIGVLPDGLNGVALLMRRALLSMKPTVEAEVHQSRAEVEVQEDEADVQTEQNQPLTC